MATIEILYTGAIDDAVDAQITQAAGKEPLSMSYEIASRERNLQFHFPPGKDAAAAVDRIRKIPFNLKVHVR